MGQWWVGWGWKWCESFAKIPERNNVSVLKGSMWDRHIRHYRLYQHTSCWFLLAREHVGSASQRVSTEASHVPDVLIMGSKQSSSELTSAHLVPNQCPWPRTSFRLPKTHILIPVQAHLTQINLRWALLGNSSHFTSCIIQTALAI